MVTQSSTWDENSSTLLSRLAASAAERQAAEKASAPVEAKPETFTAEFFTEHRTVRAELSSLEMRLSDHLNTSATAVDLRPTRAEHQPAEAHVDLTGTLGSLTKNRILFAIPITEPPRPQNANNAAWKSTVTRDCWVGIGPYRIEGKLHIDTGRDPRIAWKQVDKQFFPLTQATIQLPDGSTRACNAIFINRLYLDLLAMKDRY